ncbi:MAG: hypothetical protein V5B44_11040 [Candidatus Accumulibacter necessarius]|jgi:hypothetical protein|uniref:hypothetical protein n=1 Tax=Candidatus Accumulibacter necessarius TaxID=2954386 RepID=UPI002FC3C650
MQVMFRSGQELVKVGEIGDLIVEADCAFRLEIVGAVLAELRSDWEKLPLRNAAGLKHPARALSAVKQSMHDRAMRYAESRAYAKNLKVDAEIDAWGIQLKCLEQEKIRGGIAGPSMQVEIDGVKSRMKALQMLKAHHLQEAQEEALGKAADNIDAFVRDEYVRVSELAAWLRAEHGVDCQSYAAAEGMAALSTSTDGQIAQMLAGWFDSPIDNLPPKLQELAEAYIPNWPELSGADRRVQADEVDRQRQDALAAKFEKYRREAEQANAATPDRFKERAFQDGFNRVQRIKNGERDFEAKLGAVNLSHERCIELAHSRELSIADWIELTGVGHGWCGAFLITKKKVRFGKWDDDYISNWPLDWQRDMDRDNEQPPLKFPCTPIELLHFVDTARHDLYGFSVPDDFRQAMIAIEQATDTAQQVPDEAQGQAASSGAPKSASLRAKQAKLSEIIDALDTYAETAKLPFDRQAMPGPLGDGWNEQGSFHWLCAKLYRDFMKAPSTFEKYRAGICAVKKYAQAGDFYTLALPHIAPIFTSKKRASKANKSS